MMSKPIGKDVFIAIALIFLLIAVGGFVLVWLDIWQGAKLIVQIAVLGGAATVAVGILMRLTGKNNE